MAATKEFFICRAQPKTNLFPIHRQNTPILFIFVFPIIQREPLHRVNSSRAGSIMRANTKRYCFLMLRTKLIFRKRMFLIRFSKFRKRATARLIAQFFQERWIHRSALRFYSDAEISARADRERSPASSPSALAATLEHEIE